MCSFFLQTKKWKHQRATTWLLTGTSMTGTQVWQPTNLMIPAPSHRLQVGSVSGMGAECGGEELRGEGKEGREEELVVGRGHESEGQELSWEVFGHISVIQGCHPLWEGPCVPPAPRVPLTQLPDTKETRTVGKGLQPACSCSRNPQPPLRLSWPLLGPWASAILCGRPVAGSLAQDHGKPLLWDSSLRHPVSRLLRTTHTIWSVLTQVGKLRPRGGQGPRMRIKPDLTPSSASERQGPSRMGPITTGAVGGKGGGKTSEALWKAGVLDLQGTFQARATLYSEERGRVSAQPQPPCTQQTRLGLQLPRGGTSFQFAHRPCWKNPAAPSRVCCAVLRRLPARQGRGRSSDCRRAPLPGEDRRGLWHPGHWPGPGLPFSLLLRGLGAKTGLLFPEAGSGPGAVPSSPSP